jgi:hypothetical protein
VGVGWACGVGCDVGGEELPAQLAMSSPTTAHDLVKTSANLAMTPIMRQGCSLGCVHQQEQPATGYVAQRR